MKVKKVYDGFEGEELSDIWNPTKLEKGSYELQSKVVRKGKKAIKVTIHKGDRAEPGGDAKMTERDELLERKDLYSDECKSYRYSFSLFIPEDFPIVPTRLVLAQWKQQDEDDNATVNNPLIALRYQYEELFITLQTSEEKSRLFRTKEEIRGKWLDFVFEIKFSRGEDGFMKVLMNGAEIIDYNGVTAYSEKYNYRNPGTFYFKMGLYRDIMDEPMTVYFDEYKKERL